MPLNPNLVHGVRQETPVQSFYKEQRLQENQNLLFKRQEETLRANQVAEEQQRQKIEGQKRSDEMRGRVALMNSGFLGDDELEEHINWVNENMTDPNGASLSFEKIKLNKKEATAEIAKFQDWADKNKGILPPEVIGKGWTAVVNKHGDVPGFKDRAAPQIAEFGEPDISDDPKMIQAFEIAMGEELKAQGIQRGTQAYMDAFTEFRDATVGGIKGVGRDPETGELLHHTRFDPTIKRTDPGGKVVSTQQPRIPGSTNDKLATMDSLIEQMSVIRKVAAENPDKIGPIEGRWNKIRIKFVEDKDGTKLNRNVTSLIRLAYALSGKQISHQEMLLLREAILPMTELPDANFMESLDFAEQMLIRDRGNIENRFEDADFFVKKRREEKAASQPTQPQGETTSVTMPDGSVQTFDASGKRVQ